MAASSLEIWEDSLADEFAKGGKKFVKRAKHMAKHFPPNHRSITCHGVKIQGMSSLKNKRNKKKEQKKGQIPQENEYEQPARVPVTLTEFFPIEFFSSESEVEEEIIQCNMVSMEEYEVDTEVDEINLDIADWFQVFRLGKLAGCVNELEQVLMGSVSSLAVAGAERIEEREGRRRRGERDLDFKIPILENYHFAHA
ncbi:unnamed protein product [Prunus armeniaca]|uniref:Uncharacterized protein n=1 Tax=Prunus armeniaca TaxID=36596 RepID=A0A6J5W3B4_PRUAR|nr:unnamed protein product [Prunus armeniaca]